MYKDLFINRWKEMKQYLLLEREDGETTFLEKEVFHKFFISPELLVGFYIWRSGYTGNDKHDFSEAYDLLYCSIKRARCSFNLAMRASISAVFF